MSQEDQNFLVGTLTESLEDYLEIIYRLQHTKRVARVRDIAKEKNVKNSSVTSALNRLAKEGLVHYKAREFVDLTEVGREFAFRLHQRHTFLKRFLVDLLQVDPQTAEQDACQMEHAISVITLDRIAAFAEFLAYCPKVNEGLVTEFRDCWLKGTIDVLDCGVEYGCDIWKERAALSSKFGIQKLSEINTGSQGFVARIIGEDEIRRKLIQRGLLPATSINVQYKFDDGSYDILVSDKSLHLNPDEAKMVYIWVSSSFGTKFDLDDDRKVLAELEPGDSFKVVKLTAKGEIRQRLLDMGFTRGADGKFLREALLRDPIEIQLGDYLLSLRRAEAADIVVEEVHEPAPV